MSHIFMKSISPVLYAVVWISALWFSSANALDITITQGSETAQPIAVAPFPGSDVVTNDLRLSGEFAPLTQSQMVSTPTQLSEVNFSDWRMLDIPTLLVGRVVDGEKGRMLEFQLINVYRQKIILHYRFPLGDGNERRVRDTAHVISDLVYKALTGIEGAFRTHIAYISLLRKGGGKRSYTLEVADADGANVQVLLRSPFPLLSPSWSPDGRRLAYVSFENGRSEVWMHDIYSRKRSIIANFKGKNSAPAWSPDGKSMALSLSLDGNSEIYVMNLKSEKLRRLTKNRGADTEPAWSADGKKIVFLSDRSGRPQLYSMNLSGGRASRVTFKGRYSTSPDISPDGSQITFLNGEDGRYRIAVMDVGRSGMRLLTSNQQDESPSFSPNGRMIVYATQKSGRGVLEIVSVDGGSVQQLTLRGKDVREPVWSP